MKDPAFLFYYQDFLVGTDEMDNESIGAYIRCLCHQAHKGSISEKHMKKICNSNEVHSNIIMKFKSDDGGETFYNSRLRIEVDKRQKYTESRANNRIGKYKPTKKISKTYDIHMEDEDEDENEDENNKKGGVEKKRGITLPFDTDNFKRIWQIWKEYKVKEHSFKYKSLHSEQAALMKLSRMADGSEDMATAIIMQSIEHGWKGFFNLKDNSQNGKQRTSLDEKLRRGFDLIDKMYAES